MKTINGKNKLERQINKAKKYIQVELINSSNKYLEIKDFNKENTFILFKNEYNAKLVKNESLWVIKPLNWKDEKPIFINEYKTIHDQNWYYEKEYCF